MMSVVVASSGIVTGSGCVSDVVVVLVDVVGSDELVEIEVSVVGAAEVVATEDVSDVIDVEPDVVGTTTVISSVTKPEILQDAVADITSPATASTVNVSDIPVVLS
jgi:hypothetical protein